MFIMKENISDLHKIFSMKEIDPWNGNRWLIEPFQSVVELTTKMFSACDDVANNASEVLTSGLLITRKTRKKTQTKINFHLKFLYLWKFVFKFLSSLKFFSCCFKKFKEKLFLKTINNNCNGVRLTVKLTPVIRIYLSQD